MEGTSKLVIDPQDTALSDLTSAWQPNEAHTIKATVQKNDAGDIIVVSAEEIPTEQAEPAAEPAATEAPVGAPTKNPAVNNLMKSAE